MPLDMNDPHYLAEITPQSIVDMEDPLCDAFGVGLDHFGAKGNEYHTYGFHRSIDWILHSPDSRYGSSDYSVQGRNRNGDTRLIRAFDFTPGEWGSRDNREKMIQITRNVYDAAMNYDTRLATLFEFAGTLDGVNVITFSGQGGVKKTPFDSSHLDHAHGSLWSDTADHNHMGIVDVMLHGAGETDMSGSFGPTLMRADDDEFPMIIPPVQAGIADPRETWINIGGDLGLPAYLRIWVSKGDGAFRPLIGDGVVKVESGKRISVKLESSDSIIGVSRSKGPEADVRRTAISFCFERK